MVSARRIKLDSKDGTSMGEPPHCIIPSSMDPALPGPLYSLLKRASIYHMRFPEERVRAQTPASAEDHAKGHCKPPAEVGFRVPGFNEQKDSGYLCHMASWPEGIDSQGVCELDFEFYSV